MKHKFQLHGHIYTNYIDDKDQKNIMDIIDSTITHFLNLNEDHLNKYELFIKNNAINYIIYICFVEVDNNESKNIKYKIDVFTRIDDNWEVFTDEITTQNTFESFRKAADQIERQLLMYIGNISESISELVIKLLDKSDEKN